MWHYILRTVSAMAQHRKSDRVRKPNQFGGDYELDEDEFEWDMERYVNSLKPIKVRPGRLMNKPVEVVDVKT